MRVTENMRSNNMIANLFSNRAQYNDLTEKLASQKKINRSSDNPLSATKIIMIQQSKAAIAQYKKNIDSCNNWISATESALSGAYKLLETADGIAVGSMGADALTRKSAADYIDAITDSMRSLANTKWGDRYLFSGTQEGVEPFVSIPLAAMISTTANTMNGTPATVTTLIKDIDGYTDYLNTDYIHLEGIDTNGNVVSDDTFVLSDTTTIADLLSKIESVFGDPGDVNAFITSDGKLKVGYNTSGTTSLAVSINVRNTDDTIDSTLKFEEVQTAAGNIFAGTAVSSGTCTGTSNNTYVLKITSAGSLGTAKYRISTDGGRSFGPEENTPLSGSSIILDDGDTPLDFSDDLNLIFNDDDGAGSHFSFGENDVFYVNAIANGYYQGNDEHLSATINEGTPFEYSISGAEAFTEAGGVDIFKTLNLLKEALLNDDNVVISEQRSNIESAKEQILLCQSQCGMKGSHLLVATDNLAKLDNTLSSLLSDAQDADVTELAIKLKVSETALQASYAMAAKISEFSILNYL